MVRGTPAVPFDIPQSVLNGCGQIVSADGACAAVMTSPRRGIGPRTCLQPVPVAFQTGNPMGGDCSTLPEGAGCEENRTRAIGTILTAVRGTGVRTLLADAQFQLKDGQTPVAAEFLPPDGMPDPGDELVCVAYGDSADPARIGILRVGQRGLGTGVVRRFDDSRGVYVMEESRGTEFLESGDTGAVWISSDASGLHLVGVTTRIFTTSGELPKRYIEVASAAELIAYGAVARSKSGYGPVVAAGAVFLGILTAAIVSK